MRADIGPTHDINGVEVFAAGTWNGDTYTVEDLDEMVRAYGETQDKIKPYLKLGHDDKQKLLQKDGYPAAGYISRLYREGEKLLADFVRVPRVIYELLRVGGYRRVSSEIFVGMPVAGKVYRYLLKAVALLGGDTPAVQTLKDVLALYASATEATAYETDAPVKVYEMDAPNPQKEDVMTIEQLQAQLAEANKNLGLAYARVKELEAVEAKSKEFSEKAAAAEKRVGELETENANLKAEAKKFSDAKNAAEIKAIVDKMVVDKKIVPAQSEAAFSMILNARERGGERKYKLGDKDVSEEEMVINFFSQGTAGLPTQERSETTDPHGDPAKGNGQGEEISKKAKDYMEKHPGTTMRDALIAVSPEGTPNTGEPAKE